MLGWFAYKLLKHTDELELELGSLGFSVGFDVRCLKHALEECNCILMTVL